MMKEDIYKLKEYEKISASVIFYSARSHGICETLKFLARQDFYEPWEVVFVDANFAATKELVGEFWNELNTKVQLVHIPPLEPLIYRNWRHVWDVLAYLNTGLIYASGEVCLSMEDHMVGLKTWLSDCVPFLKGNKKKFTIGQTLDADPVYDLNAPKFYGIDRSPGIGRLGYTTEVLIKSGGFPEIPTKHPECIVEGIKIKCECEFVYPEKDVLWHFRHQIQNIARYQLTLGTYNEILYNPCIVESSFGCVISETLEQEKCFRDIIAERNKIRRWIP